MTMNCKNRSPKYQQTNVKQNKKQKNVIQKAIVQVLLWPNINRDYNRPTQDQFSSLSVLFLAITTKASIILLV